MMIDEHFGIAVAEMLRLGCIPFAHASGGPQETLGGLPLTFADDEEALRLIADCLGDADRQRLLRTRLAERAERFAPERFMQILLEHCAEVTR